MRRSVRIALDAFAILVLAVALGLLRQMLPQGIRWNGKWPTSTTSTEDAYKMFARPGDPPFLSLAETIESQQGRKATFIDARSADEYKAGHIPGARSLPFYDFETKVNDAMQGLSLNAPLVVYCEGVGCELSFFLSRELQGMGYSNIHIFYGGWPEWTGAGMPVAQ